MLIVVNDPTHVERELRARRLSCPHCGGELHPWGHARRRVLRGATTNEEHHPRRARCSNCLVTSVLLPDICLLRRVDEVAVIGRALLEKAAGAGHRTIAIRLGRPKETVRGWLRRFSTRVTLLREHFRHWAFALDMGGVVHYDEHRCLRTSQRTPSHSTKETSEGVLVFSWTPRLSSPPTTTQPPTVPQSVITLNGASEGVAGH